MTVVDANVLLYAVNRSDPNHPAARSWLERALGGAETVGLTWTVMLAFLRLVTNPRVFPAPLTLEQAVACLDEWLAQPPAVVLQPTARHLSVLHGLLAPAGTAGNLVTDAHLAALAVEHAATITSFDRDFLRFPGVRLTVPEES